MFRIISPQATPYETENYKECCRLLLPRIRVETCSNYEKNCSYNVRTLLIILASRGTWRICQSLNHFFGNKNLLASFMMQSFRIPVGIYLKELLRLELLYYCTSTPLRVQERTALWLRYWQMAHPGRSCVAAGGNTYGSLRETMDGESQPRAKPSDAGWPFSRRHQDCMRLEQPTVTGNRAAPVLSCTCIPFLRDS